MILTVIGLPAPQGSKRFLGSRNGHGVMIESSKKVKPWREAVVWAAREAVTDQALRGEAMTIPGAVSVTMVFTLPKPKSAKKGAVPSKKPDLSKLIRSTEDALTDAGVWEDDARVVQCVASKVYPNEGANALDVPGARIWISPVEGAR